MIPCPHRDISATLLGCGHHWGESDEWVGAGQARRVRESRMNRTSGALFIPGYWIPQIVVVFALPLNVADKVEIWLKRKLIPCHGKISLGQFRKAQTQIRVFAHLNPCTLVELESGQAAEELVPPPSPPSPPSPPQAPPRSHNPVPPRSPPPALPPSPPQAPPQSPTPVTHPSPLLAPPRSPLPAHASTAPPANVKGKKRNAATAALDSVEAAADDSLRRGRRLRKSPQHSG
ncbi:hypothetical protein C8J57DRAFT_1257673 [Mycena rebaudengoi]|nr:hypothetical protein C8J57DRAFT_1257673 [Mycena rebaudengoi]